MARTNQRSEIGIVSGHPGGNLLQSGLNWWAILESKLRGWNEKKLSIIYVKVTV